MGIKKILSKKEDNSELIRLYYDVVVWRIWCWQKELLTVYSRESNLGDTWIHETSGVLGDSVEDSSEFEGNPHLYNIVCTFVNLGSISPQLFSKLSLIY